MSAVQTTASWSHREAGENFPVALRLLPARHREHLHAVYAYARTVDELGDSFTGDRAAALLLLREETRSIWAGATPISPMLRLLAGTVRACGLSEQPFLDLIEANLRDQRVHRYPTFADLVGYCRLSADPVGRIVLELFGCSTPERVLLSDRVCTGLQLVEHLQDVAEDRRAGRVYLPQDSLQRYGVAESDLDATHASAALRRCVLAETDRAE
jgi:squalene synthase HpnC